jgi:hypothetical protein
MSKLFGILAGLEGRSDAAVIVISAMQKSDGHAERDAMKQLISQTINEIEKQYSMR